MESRREQSSHDSMLPDPLTAARAIRAHWNREPAWGIILGTGLGILVDRIDVECTLSYAEIPGFLPSTAPAHAGRLVCGRIGSRAIVALQGRSHFYEGHSRERLMFPVRTLGALGVKNLIVTNAAGGMNPAFRTGDCMAIEDHMDLMFRCGGSSAINVRPVYDRALLEEARIAARRTGITLQRGVYVGVTGPNYETRAEYRMFRRIGGDAVGMSTIPETAAAAECGMRVLGFSAITNIAQPDAPAKVDAEEVADVAGHAAPNLAALILNLLANHANLRDD